MLFWGFLLVVIVLWAQNPILIIKAPVLLGPAIVESRRTRCNWEHRGRFGLWFLLIWGSIEWSRSGHRSFGESRLYLQQVLWMILKAQLES